jgi:hypothetical protein
VQEQAHPLLPPLIKLVLPVGEIDVVEKGDDDAEGDNGVEVALLTEGKEEVSWNEEHEQDEGGDDAQKTACSEPRPLVADLKQEFVEGANGQRSWLLFVTQVLSPLPTFSG